VPEQRNATSDFAQQQPGQHQHREAADHVVGKLFGHDGEDRHERHGAEHRKRHAADRKVRQQRLPSERRDARVR
jgi:hypothetical protein